ncbi:hypothetical protein [Paraburkholderia sediminicola]|uniref:hypothetical protein n=1 Tax=Paraburkholderia sediminicola TaxID=458836 RepID=UPI0038BDFFFC
MVSATAGLLGHVLERPRVERAVSAIASRKWNAKDRLLIASSLTMGLTYRMSMTGINSGLLEPIPPHPGRTIPFSLLEEWMAGDDYEPRDRLRITLDAVRLGVPVAAKDLRQVFDAAMAAPVGEEHSDGSVAGRALEVLYANGEAPPLHQLEFWRFQQHTISRLVQ